RHGPSRPPRRRWSTGGARTGSDHATSWQEVVHNATMQIDRLRALPRPLAYVLPGGGALAAYQVGVLEALTAAGLQPDRLIGVSAGAMNAAMFAWSSDVEG